jgi:hypothetical protein
MSYYSYVLESYTIDDYANEGAIGDFFKKIFDFISEKVKKVIEFFKKLLGKSEEAAKDPKFGFQTPEGPITGISSDKQGQIAAQNYVRKNEAQKKGSKSREMIESRLNSLLLSANDAYVAVNKTALFFEKYGKKELKPTSRFSANEFNEFSKYSSSIESKVDKLQGDLDKYDEDVKSKGFGNVKVKITSRMVGLLKKAIERLEYLKKTIDSTIKKFKSKNDISKYDSGKDNTKKKAFASAQGNISSMTSKLSKHITNVLKLSVKVQQIINSHCTKKGD